MAGYEVLGELGRGGVGVVYKARQAGLRRVVALKMLLAGAHAGPDQLARFRVEAEAVARLQHPNIVQIYEVGQWEGRPYLALEFVDGDSLKHALSGNPRPARCSAQLAATLAGVVHYAHQHGVVHRDLKPANILLQRKSETRSPKSESALSDFGLRISDFDPKVSDFGLAKQLAGESGPGSPTCSGDILGTPSYMAPEQAAGGKDVGPAADVYALGAVLYECLTGRPPFQAATPLETLAQLLDREPASPQSLNPGVPRDLETICLKCLAKEPARRYATAQALADDLGRFLDGRPVLARPVGVWGRAARWARRRPALAALTGSLTGVVVISLLGLTALWLRADRDRTAAEVNLGEARANLRLAVDAIDQYFTRVSEDERLKEHDFRALRRQLLRSAAEFHEQLLARRSDDPVLRAELARSLARLGRLTAEIDAKPRAIEYYQEALAAFQRLTAADPAEVAYRAELADCHVSLGQLYAATAATVEAEAAFHEARRLIEALVRDDPSGLEHRRRLAALCRRQGTFLRQQTRAAEAEPLLREAVALCKSLVRDQPDDITYLQALVESHCGLGHLYHHGLIHRWREAVTAFEDALVIQQQVVRRAPADPDYRSALGRLYCDLGRVYMLGNRHAESEDAFVRGIAVQKALTREHANVASYLAVLAGLYKHLGSLYEGSDRLDAAQQPWEESIRLWERLVDRDPTEIGYATALGDLQGRMGFASLYGRKDAAGALVLLDRAVGTLEGVRARDDRLLGARRTLKDAYGYRAEAFTALQRHAEALRDYDRVVALAEPLFRPYARAQRALALAHSGDVAGAVADARKAADGLTVTTSGAQATFLTVAKTHAVAAEVVRRDPALSDSERTSLAERYSVEAIEWLREAVRAGTRLTSPTMRSQEFDGLRSRHDFQSLFAGK